MTSIPIEIASSQQPAAESAALLALLSEIETALGQLVESGESHAIDLNTLPLGEGGWQQLESLLGRGEIDATLHVAGHSTIRECSYPGVWLVEHYNEAGSLLTRLIEITPVPALLVAAEEEIAEGARRLAAVIEQGDEQ